MSPERWQHINELYLVARDLDPDSRAAYLEAVCGADRHLLAAVMSLIAVEEKDPRDEPREIEEPPIHRPPVKEPVEDPDAEKREVPIEEPIEETAEEKVDETAEENVKEPVYQTTDELSEDHQPADYPTNGDKSAHETSSRARKFVGILKGFLRRGPKPSAGARS